MGVWILAAILVLSLLLLGWQLIVAFSFPIQTRFESAHGPQDGITVIKPIQGARESTRQCLETWCQQDYKGPIQILLGVDGADQQARDLVNRLKGLHSEVSILLVPCEPRKARNPKISKLIQCLPVACHETIVFSDEDIAIPADLLSQCRLQLEQDKSGMVTCLYRMADATNFAMRLEQVAMNADFWSQVLQARFMGPLRFALGSVMVTSREAIRAMGGLERIGDYLADDYRLGLEMSRTGRSIHLSPIAVDCYSGNPSKRAIWERQKRWARTTRFCKPIPYFFSVLNNVTIWALLFWLAAPTTLWAMPLCALAIFIRILAAMALLQRFAAERMSVGWGMLAPVKDLFQFILWAQAFLGNSVRWRGKIHKVTREGRLLSSDG